MACSKVSGASDPSEHASTRLPTPRHPEDLDAFAEFLAAVIPARDAVYVSTPITTGYRYVAWWGREGKRLATQAGHDSKEYAEAHTRSVIVPNIEEGRRTVRRAREQMNRQVIDPTQLHRPEWGQDQYRYLWGRVIELFADTLVLVDGWEYSSGCSYEYLVAARQQLRILDERFGEISLETGTARISEAIAWYENNEMAPELLHTVQDELLAIATRTSDAAIAPHSPGQQSLSNANLAGGSAYKDSILDSLAFEGNVAQFVSFGPGGLPEQRFCHLQDIPANHRFASVRAAIDALHQRSAAGTVNVRRFDPSENRRFNLAYGLDVAAAETMVCESALKGWFAIVNETIDVHDGGVSGVALGNIVEFAPDDTPQCVHRPGVCSLPRDLGLRLLNKVYGFRPAINYAPDIRVEFSIHPSPLGIRADHTIIWELERFPERDTTAHGQWPNRFSEMLGDKLFGLLLADEAGLPVPATVAVTRRVGTIRFGRATPSHERWIRTCPAIPSPGLFPTFRGWRDPFHLLESAESDPREPTISSVLDQSDVPAAYSGVAESQKDGVAVEGVRGRGDDFMLGRMSPEEVAPEVLADVRMLHRLATQKLGPLRMEWVHDGRQCWVVQLQSLGSANSTIISGEPSEYLTFDVAGRTPSDLSEFVAEARQRGAGIILRGHVGILSHFGDILRREGIPSRIERP